VLGGVEKGFERRGGEIVNTQRGGVLRKKRGLFYVTEKREKTMKEKREKRKISYLRKKRWGDITSE